MNYEKRAQRLVEKIDGKGNFDSVIITSLPSLRYFFNYSGKSYERFCCGLITRESPEGCLVVPELDRTKAEQSSTNDIYSWTDNTGYQSAIQSAARDFGINTKSLGCELGISLRQMDEFKESLGTQSFVGVSEEISTLREIKDDLELQCIRSAAKILSKAYKFIPEVLRAGKSEAEVAFEIRRFLGTNGAENVDFCAVQSGKNSAIPHSLVSKRILRKGDLVVVDITCQEPKGYFADFTRTFSVGPPSSKQKKIYEIVKSAQARALEACESGRQAHEIDQMARSTIQKAGYGEYFTHRTGHGLGLEEHEAPWIKEGNFRELERGMVFTVEPGIYLPGHFGVRIEDNIIVEKTRSSNITRLEHDLVVV